MKSIKILLFCLVMALIAPSFSVSSYAADVFWQDAVNGDWSDGSKWSSGSAPGSNDDVFITVGGSYTVTLNVPGTIRSLTVGGTTGTQKLKANLNAFNISADSEIRSNGILVLKNTSFSGAATLTNNGSIKQISANIAADLTNNASITVEEIGADSEYNGEVHNSTTGQILLRGTASKISTLETHKFFFNEGLITLSSSSATFGPSLVIANGRLVNATDATIETVPGSGAARTITVQTGAGFLNNGDLDIQQDATIFNNSQVTNCGVVIATTANLSVFHGVASHVFRNKGTLLTSTGSQMNFVEGTFFVTTGTISGDGTFSFSKLEIADGVLEIACTKVVFEGNVNVENNAGINNNGKMVTQKKNNIFGSFMNGTTATLDINAVGTDFDAELQFFNGGVNNGTISMNSKSLSSFTSIGINNSGGTFVNNGNLNAKNGPNDLHSSRNVNNSLGTFNNNGNINSFTSANLSIFNTDGNFNSGPGNINAFTSSFVSVIGEFSMLPTPRPITTGNLNIATTALISFSSFGGGDFNIGSPITSATMHNNGQAFFDGGNIFTSTTASFLGNGTYNFERTNINGNLNFPITSSTVRIVDSHSITSANIGFSGSSQLAGCNTFDGPVEIRTTASLFISDPQFQTGPISKPYENHFNNSVINNGSLYFNHTRTTATLFISSATFHNFGSVTFASVSTSANICLGNGSSFINATTASIFGANNTKPISFLQKGDSNFQNCGKLVFVSPFSSATIRVDAEGNSVFSNKGQMKFRNFATTASIVTFSGNSRYVNDGLLDFSDFGNKAGSEVNVRDNAKLENNGQINFSNFKTTASIAVFNSGCANNNGSMNFNRVITTASISMSSMSVFNNATTASISFTENGGSIVDMSDQSTFNNNGSFRFRNFATTATIFVQDDSKYINNGRFEARDGFTTANICPDGNGRFLQNGNMVFTTASIAVDFKSSTSINSFTMISSSSLFLSTTASFILRSGTTAPNGAVNGQGTFLYEQMSVLGNGPNFSPDTKVKVKNSNFPITSASVFLPGCADFIGSNEFTTSFSNATTISMSPNSSGDAFTNEFNNDVNNDGNWQAKNITTTANIVIGPNKSFNNNGSMDFSKLGTSANLFLSSGSVFNHRGRLNVSSATINIIRSTSAVILFGSNGTINLNQGRVNFVPQTTASIALPTGASLSGSGVYNMGNIVNNGRIGPGSSPGCLILLDDLIQTASSSMDIELGGTSACIDFDRLSVDDLTLDGALNVSLIDGFIPADGDRFRFLEYNSVTGAFASINLDTPGFDFTLEFGTQAAVLIASEAAAVTVNLDVYLHGYWTGDFHKRTPLMLELRTGATLIASTLVQRQSALQSSTARAVFSFDELPEGDYWLVLRHGGHLPIGSAAPINIAPGATLDVDFTDPDNVFNGATWLPEETINNQTFNVMRTGDLNANRDIGADDFIEFFVPNFGLSNPGQVPLLDD